MISHSYRCIFVHIPRAGGTSLENAIWPGNRTESDLWMGFTDDFHNKYQTGGLQHLSATQIRAEVGAEIFETYYKFSIIRNPWSRIVSQFSLMSRRPDLREFIGMDEHDSFKRYLELIQRKTHVQWEQQHKFVLDDNGEPLVDFVGRFEAYDSAVSQILRHLKISAQIGHAEATLHRPYAEYYDAETKDLVRDLYSDDVRIFNYSFS